MKLPVAFVAAVKPNSRVPDLIPATFWAAVVAVETWAPVGPNTVTVNVDTLPSASAKSALPETGTEPPPVFRPMEAGNRRLEIDGGVFGLEEEPPPPLPPQPNPEIAKTKSARTDKTLVIIPPVRFYKASFGAGQEEQRLPQPAAFNLRS